MKLKRHGGLIVAWAFFVWLGSWACSQSTIDSSDSGLDTLLPTETSDDPSHKEVPLQPENLDPKEFFPPICDEMFLKTGSVAPNLLLVVDRSGSMQECFAYFLGMICIGGKKIDGTKTAISAMLEKGQEKIRFGWMQFPSDNQCQAGEVLEECREDSVTAIRDRLNELAPNGATPTSESLEIALGYFEGFGDNPVPNYIVLLTDGMPNCSQNPNQDALDAVKALRNAGVETFVIGLGGGFFFQTYNRGLLNSMAEAGGRPRVNTEDKFYAVETMEELDAALGEIGGMVISCNFKLDPIPQYPKHLWLYFDGDEIPRDPSFTEGWEYDEVKNQVVVYGDACARLQSGEVEKVDVKMGCPPED